MKLKFERTIDGNRKPRYSARKDGWLFVLTLHASDDTKAEMDRAVHEGREVEVMIIGGLGSHVRGLTVDMVSLDYDLVEHSGFECSGSMCTTTARVPNAPYGTGSMWITPGRCQGILPVAENVNVRYGDTPAPLTPGRVYVRRGERRAAGVPTLDDICLETHAAAARFRKAYQARKAA